MTAKKKNGRPPKNIDYPILENLCRIQATADECAAVLGMNYDTLLRHLKADGHESFKTFHEKHTASGRASLRRMQWKGAEAGNPTMQIWLGKNYLNQSDKLEHSGNKDNPVQIEISGLMDKLKRMAEVE